MENDKILLLGPGHSVSQHKDEILSLKGDVSILAFQGVFPHCYTHFGLIPDYWFSADPNSWMEGFEFLTSLSPEQQEQFKHIQILIPAYAASTYATFRMYSGTTPLARQQHGWQKYQILIAHLRERGFDIQEVPCTSTKYLANTTANQSVDICHSLAYARFMGHEVVYGTVPFDSESVIGDQFKWGLENKLSSHVFPTVFYLGYKQVYVAGFDFKGPRFYSNDTRHPWNDETQNKNVAEFPLNLVKKWVEWERLHGMKIYSAVEPELTLLSDIIPTEPLIKTQGEDNERSF